jgi:hypothetical protein
MGVPTSPPRGEKSLGGETSWEVYSAPGACSPWTLSQCYDWFCWSAAGLGWWAAGFESQYVSGLYSVC